jgi:hypothetical protein
MEIEGNSRYMRLHAIVEDIKSQKLVRTTEWYAEHAQLLLVYERHFETFSGVHPEIKDETFRKNCTTLDTLMKKLLREYDSHEWFSLYDYLIFNQVLICVADHVLAINEDCEKLEDLFQGLTV